MKLVHVLVVTAVLACGLSSEQTSSASDPPLVVQKAPTIGRRAVDCVSLPLVARFTFDGAMVDSAGGNAAFVAGAVAPTFGAGRFGQALHFTSGANATTTIKALPDQWTTAQWIKQQGGTYPDQATVGNGCALFFGNDAVVSGAGVNWVGAYTRGGGNSTCTSPVSTFLNVENVTAKSVLNGWTHLVTVFDGTTGHVYQDGVSIGPTTAFPYNYKTPKTWRLGAIVDTNEKHTFVGAIDELRVFGVALTADQVRNLWDHNDTNAAGACPAPPPPPSIVVPKEVKSGG